METVAPELADAPAGNNREHFSVSNDSRPRWLVRREAAAKTMVRNRPVSKKEAEVPGLIS